MNIVSMEDNAAITELVWGKKYKKTLEEKHGVAGAIGERGELNAYKILPLLYPNSPGAIHHKDSLHQLQGIDFTVLNNTKNPSYVDVKSGSSSLYYDKDVGGKQGWYFTVRKKVLFEKNKTNVLLLLGPKGDVYVAFSKRKMQHHFWDMDVEEVRIYKNDWPEFIKTNIL